MNGKTLAAGAVAGLHHVKNPITLARAVMEKSAHVMMVGDGAEKFAKEQNIELSTMKNISGRRSVGTRLQKILQQEKEKSATPKSKGMSEKFRRASLQQVWNRRRDRTR
jgi:beta-aspartyl-peptidase (threonine type)